jgi:hypothetical protein
MLPAVHLVRRGLVSLRFAHVRKPSRTSRAPCLDCTTLVGADALQKPHRNLRLAEPEDRPGQDVVRCRVCASLWMLLPRGWARVPD